MSTALTRRAAILGAAASTAALAVPAVAITQKIDPAPALDAKDAQLLHFLNTASPADLAEYHVLQLGVALAKSRGGRWVAKDISSQDSGYDLVIFVQHPDPDTSFMQVFA